MSRDLAKVTKSFSVLDETVSAGASITVFSDLSHLSPKCFFQNFFGFLVVENSP